MLFGHQVELLFRHHIVWHSIAAPLMGALKAERESDWFIWKGDNKENHLAITSPVTLISPKIN